MLLIGGGSSAFREGLIREYPELEDRIHAVGHVDAREPQLAAYLGACDLLIQPYPDGVTSRRTTVMAALSHGRPTISTSGDLTEPFWQSSGALMLTPAGAHDAFVDSAVQSLDNTPERLSLGESGQKFYTREFDIQHIVELLRAGDRP
jgi:glycosyltransferase involved in cell wall biosynthesis